MGILILGAVVIFVVVFVLLVQVPRSILKGARQSELGVQRKDYLAAALTSLLPVGMILPAVPGMFIAKFECQSRGGEQTHKLSSANGYRVAWSKHRQHYYGLSNLAFDLLERRFAFVEVAPEAGEFLERAFQLPIDGLGARFFIDEERSPNCLPARRNLAGYFSALPSGLCVSAEKIDQVRAPYTVSFREETRYLPLPLVWRVTELKKTVEGTLVAEHRGFWYRPYGEGLLSAFAGMLVGSGSLTYEGLFCEAGNLYGGLFPNSLLSARRQISEDERVRASSVLKNFYSVQ